LFNRETITLSVQVLLFTLAGFFAGIRAQDRVNQRNFNRGCSSFFRYRRDFVAARDYPPIVS
jgi:hypothetical protein